MGKRVKSNIGLVCLGLGLVFVYFFPILVAGPNTLPSTFPDAWSFTWNIWRFGEVFSDPGEGLYHTAKLFHPYGTSLALHTQAEGVLLPLSFLLPFLSPFQVFSVAALLCFALNFLAAYWLFSKFLNLRSIAFFLALLFTFHPFFIGHLDAGHINFLVFFPVSVVFGITLSAIRDRKIQFAPIASLSIALAFLAYTNLYYLYFSGLALLMFSLIYIRRIPKGLFVGFVGGLLLALPKVLAVIGAYGTGGFREDHLPSEHSAELFHYFVPGQNQRLSEFLGTLSSTSSLSHAENGLYLGISLLLIVVCLLVRKRQNGSDTNFSSSILGFALLFLWLSLGPAFKLFSLFELLPFFPSVPARFGVFALLFLFVWIAIRIGDLYPERLPQSKGLVVVAVLGVISIIEFFPAKLPMSQLETPISSLTMIREDSSISALHDFTRNHYSRLLHQMTHGKNITSAFVARSPKEPLTEYRKNEFLLAVRKGVRHSDEEITGGWSRLKIDAVLVGVDQDEYEERLAEIPWLVRAEERFWRHK